MLKFDQTDNNETAITKTCDRCQKEATASLWDDWQEFLHLRAKSGYGSKIGDGVRYACDLCESCVSELLGPYLRQWEDDSELRVENDLEAATVKHIGNCVAVQIIH